MPNIENARKALQVALGTTELPTDSYLLEKTSIEATILLAEAYNPFADPSQTEFNGQYALGKVYAGLGFNTPAAFEKRKGQKHFWLGVRDGFIAKLEKHKSAYLSVDLQDIMLK